MLVSESVGPRCCGLAVSHHTVICVHNVVAKLEHELPISRWQSAAQRGFFIKLLRSRLAVLGAAGQLSGDLVEVEYECLLGKQLVLSDLCETPLLRR
jgi:hypothetical protein